MIRLICEHNICTGCAACRDACPRQCISMQPDKLDALYPQIDEKLCIDCGICDRTCPNSLTIMYRHPQKVLAAWSKDNEVRRTSASGGIAYELYRYWIKNGGVATGVVYNREEGCHFVLLEKETDIYPTQNSKYTFSDTDGIYKVVKEKLQVGCPVLFIGVPCQVAGLYGFLKKEYDNLVTVDLICHGMPPANYLKQHIENIESKKHERASELYFRDPKYYTYTFTFTLRNEAGKEFYKKRVLNTDNYQLGYHRSLIYRENCYRCRYARKERISDLTIGDFSGLGKFAPFDHEKKNVSCILQNTAKGAKLLSKIEGIIALKERPKSEAFEVEKQLKFPSAKHSGRRIFEDVYASTKDFENASDMALRTEKIKAFKQRLVVDVKKYIRSFVPHRILYFVRGK